MTNTKNKNSRVYSRKGKVSNHSGILALVIIIIVLVVVVIIVFATKSHDTLTNEPTVSDSPKPTVTTPSISTDPESPNDSENNPTEPEDKVTQYEGENPNKTGELSGVIISKSIDGNALTIITMINQYLSKPGICVLTLNGKTYNNSYTASSDALADITTSYCENFEVPISDLKSDSYTIKIELTADGKTGVIYDEVDL